MATLINLKRGAGIYDKYINNVWTYTNSTITSAEPWVNKTTKQLWIDSVPVNPVLRISSNANQGIEFSTVLLDSNNTAYQTLNIPRASVNYFGTVKLKSSQSPGLSSAVNEPSNTGTLYPLQLTSDGVACVKVPDMHVASVSWNNGTSSTGPSFTLNMYGASAIPSGAIPQADIYKYGVTKLSNIFEGNGSDNQGTAATTYALGQVAQRKIDKNIGISAGDMLYWSASGVPQRLPIGTSGQVLSVGANNTPQWVAGGSSTDTNTRYVVHASKDSLLDTSWDIENEPRYTRDQTVDNNPIALLGTDDSVKSLEHVQKEWFELNDSYYEVGSVVKYYRPGAGTSTPIYQDIVTIDGGIFGGTPYLPIPNPILGVITNNDSLFIEDRVYPIVDHRVNFGSYHSPSPDAQRIPWNNSQDTQEEDILEVPIVNTITVPTNYQGQIRIGVVWSKVIFDENSRDEIASNGDIIGPSSTAIHGDAIGALIMSESASDSHAIIGKVSYEYSGGISGGYTIFYSLSEDVNDGNNTDISGYAGERFYVDPRAEGDYGWYRVRPIYIGPNSNGVQALMFDASSRLVKYRSDAFNTIPSAS